MAIPSLLLLLLLLLQDGFTPLMQVALKGRNDAVTLLLEEGADVSLKNKVSGGGNTMPRHVFSSVLLVR